MSKGTRYCLLLGVLIVVLFALNLIMGSVSIPLKDVANIIFNGVTERESWRFIILGSRLPQALTALLCGRNDSMMNARNLAKLSGNQLFARVAVHPRD